jgi:hypothetical protein
VSASTFGPDFHQQYVFFTRDVSSVLYANEANTYVHMHFANFLLKSVLMLLEVSSGERA